MFSARTGTVNGSNKAASKLKVSHERCPVQCLPVPKEWHGKNLREITIQNTSLSGLVTIALVDRDPNGSIYGLKHPWLLDVIVNDEDLAMLRGLQSWSGPRSWRRLCSEVLLPSSNTVVPEGYGLAASALQDAQAGDTLCFEMRRFDVFPGPATQLHLGERVCLLCSQRATVEVLLQDHRDIFELRGSLITEKDGRCSLAHDVTIYDGGQKVELLKGFVLLGSPGQIDLEEIEPGAGLRFAYNPELRLERLLQSERLASVRGHLDMDCFAFSRHLFKDGVNRRALGPPDAIRGEYALDLRSSIGFGLVGIATPVGANCEYQVEWAPGANSFVQWGSLGLVPRLPSSIPGLAAEPALRDSDLDDWFVEVEVDIMAESTTTCTLEGETRQDSIRSPGWLFRSYKIAVPLASTANSAVFLAVHKKSERCIVVKEMSFGPLAHHENGKLKLALQELEFCRTLQHDRIVQHLGDDCEIGPTGHLSKIYLLFEYCSGGPLDSVYKKNGPVVERDIRKYTQQVLEGLVYLHDACVVHRDLKCQNLLLTHDSTVKLADLGVSKVCHSVTDKHEIVGTVPWMAPEVLTLEDGPSTAMDIWSLGCCIIELASATNPYAEITRDQNQLALRRIAFFKSKHTHLFPKVPESTTEIFENFLDWCLKPEPSERMTAEELLCHEFCQIPKTPMSTKGKSPRSECGGMMDLTPTEDDAMLPRAFSRKLMTCKTWCHIENSEHLQPSPPTRPPIGRARTCRKIER